MSISCLRFHHVVPERKHFIGDDVQHGATDLWGWTDALAAGRAMLLALEVPWTGCEIMYVVGEEHCADGMKAEDLAKKHFPDAVLRRKMGDKEGFFDCSRAEKLLGWKHTGGRELQSSSPHVARRVKDGNGNDNEKRNGKCLVM
ncbi:hypothetical protein FRC07_007104 [Ceratobasidium sp. 392]|nr:hypothetical protein FRC07_007104 [Ceratobasidium sp. 392]